MHRIIGPQVLLLAAAGVACGADFERDVRPILAKNCLGCHGPEKQESGLRVDSVARLLQGGDRGPAIVPGKSGESLLIRALSGGDDVERMPAEAEPLSAAQIATLRQWIDEGAKPPAGDAASSRKSDHWSFRPVVRPPLPTVREPSWCQTPVDRFIRHRLEQESLKPSDAAPRATLIRRVSFDLVGLPPRPEEVDAFVADQQPDAYERVVDRLLASPHHGERWGRHWLDQARYADSHGFTIDGPRSIWKYRDWVIAAINRDLPFDQFTIEQIAGDLLPAANADQIIATGFHRNTLINQEGGTDPEQFRVEAVVDRVNTTGAVFLGLTIGCAQCHTHKYDPITHREYYKLFAFFNQCDEPNILAPTPVQAMQLARIKNDIAAVEKRLRKHEKSAPGRTRGVAWTLLEPTEFRSAGGAMLVKLDDQSLLVTGDSPATDTYTVTAETSLRGITAVRIEALTHDSLPKRGPGLSETGNFVLNSFKLAVSGHSAAGGELRAVTIDQAFADESAKNRPIAAAIDNDPKTSWTVTVKPDLPNRDYVATFVLKGPTGGDATRLVFTWEHQDLVVRSAFGRMQLWATTAPREAVVADEEIRAILALPAEKRSKTQKDRLAAHLASSDPDRAKLVAQHEDLKRQERQLVGKISTTMVLRERPQPRETHVHLRGDFLRKGPRVQPGVPAVLPAIDVPPPKRNRLALARWLVSAENPLTPRVTVNRLWQRYFGVGLVETENDFGIQGTPPTHPELLDWLARELVARGWSQKEMHRLVVTSAVYRQTSALRGDVERRDPRNKLLARQARLRLDAEVIRDAALAAGGLLTRKIGGPSVFPPQPQGVYRFTQQDKQWRESEGEDRFRRGLYTFFYRSSPHPMLTTFDAPGGTATCTRRLPSNTPLQALTLANDRGMIEIAQGLATAVLGSRASDDRQRLEHAFRLCLARSPSPAEMARLSEFLHSQRNRSDAEGKNDTIAWTNVARVLFNLDEFITRE
jgi:hypothetical protein